MTCQQLLRWGELHPCGHNSLKRAQIINQLRHFLAHMSISISEDLCHHGDEEIGPQGELANIGGIAGLADLAAK